MPGDLSNYIQRGLVYQDMGNHEYAVRDFESAININPNDSNSYLHKGNSRLKQNLVHEAIEDFNQAKDLGEDPAVYNGLGCCYHQLRDFDEAIDYFN